MSDETPSSQEEQGTEEGMPFAHRLFGNQTITTLFVKGRPFSSLALVVDSSAKSFTLSLQYSSGFSRYVYISSIQGPTFGANKVEGGRETDETEKGISDNDKRDLLNLIKEAELSFGGLTTEEGAPDEHNIVMALARIYTLTLDR